MFSFGRRQQEDCGLKCIIKDDWRIVHIPVPLKAVDISTRLINFLAEVTISQTYVNMEEAPIECEYMFPIEEEAAIIDFKAELEGRTVVSKVKKNEEAEKDYKEAVEEGKTGFLAQSVRPDILQMKIGHLSPGAKCTISLTYIVEAVHDAGKIRLTIPTTISPKYVPFHDNSVEAKKIQSIKYDFNTPAPMKFTMAAKMKTSINEVTSPSHSIKVTGLQTKKPGSEGLYEAKVELSSSTSDLDRDIIILVQCESAAGSQVLKEKSDDSSVLMVSLVPNLQLALQPALDIVFLVDCSGSMMGSSIKLARDAMNILLHSLPSTAHFNIVRFGSSHRKLFDRSMPYSDDTLGIARNAMLHMEADLGGTEILSPLSLLLTEKTELPRRVFVLTDGSVSNSMECLKVTRKHNKTTKVFTLGIGSSADRHLVKGLARAGMGTYEFTVEEEMIAPKVIKQLKHCLQPNLANVEIDWGKQADPNNSCQAPGSIPALFNGNRIQVFRLLDNNIDLPAKIKISADIPSSEDSYLEEIDVDSNFLNGELLHKMFARKMIQELEEKEEEEDKSEVKDIITELAVKYQLMSKYTSIIAVDTKENKSHLAMQSRNVPNQIPSGFHGMQRQRGLFGSPNVLAFAAPPGAPSPFSACSKRAPASSICNFRYIPTARFGSAAPTASFDSVAPTASFDSAAPTANFGNAASTNSFGAAAPTASFGSAAPTARFDAPVPMTGCGGFGSSPKNQASSGFSFGATGPVCGSLFGASPSSPSYTPTSPGAASDFEPEYEQPANNMAPIDKVIALISLQSANGEFKKNKKIVNVLGLDQDEVDKLEQDSEEKHVYTLLVILALEVRFLEFKSSWELVADKAEQSLKTAGDDLSILRQKIKDMLKA